MKKLTSLALLLAYYLSYHKNYYEYANLHELVTIERRYYLSDTYNWKMIQVVVLYYLTIIMDSTMNLISRIYHEYEKKEHHITVLKKYLIITSYNYQPTWNGPHNPIL